jgi:MFS family permease
VSHTEPTSAVPRIRDLHPYVHRLLVGNAFAALGGGLTMPFLYVYLAHVRGIATTTVGLLFAWMGLLGFVLSPVGGSLIDRFGPRPVMLAGLTGEAIAVAAIGRIDSVGSAFVVASMMTVGSLGLYPAATAMYARLVPESARQRVYGVQFMTLNAGLGVGGLIGSTMVDLAHPASFERLYLLNASSYLVYLVIVASLPRGTGSLPSDSDSPVAADGGPSQAGGGAPQPPAPGWSAVLRDRTALRLTGVSILAITFGYAQMEAGFTAYAVDVAGIPTNALGWAFGANTGIIVLGQLVTLRLIEGRSRTRLLAVAGLTWSLSWLVVALAAPAHGGWAVVCAVLGLGIFGLAETIWAPIAPAIYNALAVEELRGRYNALQSMVWTVGSIIGPAVAGMLIGHGLAAWWVAMTVGGTLVAALGFLRLRRYLTDEQDGLTPADGPDAVSPSAPTAPSAPSAPSSPSAPAGAAG